MITYFITRIVVYKMWTYRKKVRNKKIVISGLIVFAIAIFCDRILFPKVFHNVVHSRYFSLQGDDKQLDSLFLTRNRNCALKAISYWKSRERPTNFESRNLNNIEDSEGKGIYMNAETRTVAYSHFTKTQKHNFELLIMVISVRRSNEKYLLHVAKRLNQQVEQYNNDYKGNKGRHVKLAICNSHADVEEHKNATYLSQFIDVISINRESRSHKCCTKENW